MITSIDNIESELAPEVVKARKAIINFRKPEIVVNKSEFLILQCSGLLGGSMGNQTYQGIAVKVID